MITLSLSFIYAYRWVNINTTDTSYLVDGLIPDSLYTFEVKVVRGADESIPSLENYARTSEATGWEGMSEHNRELSLQQ